MKKIFILLPHKDQFVKTYSGSASIWVKDFYKKSTFKKNITVFGSTKNLKDIINKKIYVNLDIPIVKFKSRTKIYLILLLQSLISQQKSFFFYIFLRI